MKEVENSLRKDVVEKVIDTQGARALWISKRWWRYRPKLPYTYFLQKLDSSEASVIFRDVPFAFYGYIPQCIVFKVAWLSISLNGT